MHAMIHSLVPGPVVSIDKGVVENNAVGVVHIDGSQVGHILERVTTGVESITTRMGQSSGLVRSIVDLDACTLTLPT